MNLSLKNKFLFAFVTGLGFAMLYSLANYFFLDREFSWWMFGFWITKINSLGSVEK